MNYPYPILLNPVEIFLDPSEGGWVLFHIEQ